MGYDYICEVENKLMTGQHFNHCILYCFRTYVALEVNETELGIEGKKRRIADHF